VSYKPTEVRETQGQPMASYLHICCMDQYKIYSPDMTRWEAYKKGGPSATPTTAFGAPSTSTFGQPNTSTSAFSFGGGSSTTNSFGATSTNNSSPFSFGGNKPSTGTTPSFSFGQSSTPAPSMFGTNTGASTFGSFSTPTPSTFGTPNSNANTTTFGGSFGNNTNSPSQFSFGNNANNNASSNSFSFGNTSNNSTNSAPSSSFSFGNAPTTQATTGGFGSFTSPTASPSSFNFGNTGNKPAAFGTNNNSSFSFTNQSATTATPGLFGGGFSSAATNTTQQQPKMELALNHEPYGKLPEVAMPPSRTRPLPPLVAKPTTPSSAAANYKLTPKTMKRLMIMESPATHAQGDNEQRVLNELLSPHTHVKKLVITEADQQNLSLFESARKQQKSVLKDLSNQQKEQQSQFSPPPTPYQAPRKPTISLSKPEDRQTEQLDQTSLRQSAKDNSLSLSVKPTPIRVTPSDSFYQNPSLESATNVNSVSKSRDYNSYTEAVIDNRTDAEIDKSVPVPKCTRNGVHTVPSMDIFLKMTKDELMNVRDFTVFKEDVGKVTFLGTTDVRGLDIDRIVAFKDREIVVYPNESDKPIVGEGLNKPAEITLFKCWAMDKKTNRPTDDPTELEAFVKKLKRRCRKWGVQYKSYENGKWTFALENFD